MKERLTPREIEVRDLLLKGLTYQKIADILFITTDTVNAHVHHIFQKFNFKNRYELFTYEIDQLKLKTVR